MLCYWHTIVVDISWHYSQEASSRAPIFRTNWIFRLLSAQTDTYSPFFPVCFLLLFYLPVLSLWVADVKKQKRGGGGLRNVTAKQTEWIGPGRSRVNSNIPTCWWDCIMWSEKSWSSLSRKVICPHQLFALSEAACWFSSQTKWKRDFAIYTEELHNISKYIAHATH